MGDGFEAERADQPQRAVAHESFHVLPPNQRHVFAELETIEIEQHAAMLDLLLSHLFEHLGRARILLAQPVGEPAIDAGILLLIGDGERENFLFAQVCKTFHRGIQVGRTLYSAVLE